MREKEQIFLQCDCDCSNLVVTKYKDGGFMFGIYHNYVGFVPNSLKTRIKFAIKSLFGKPIYYSTVVVDDIHKVFAFQNDLGRLLCSDKATPQHYSESESEELSKAAKNL